MDKALNYISRKSLHIATKEGSIRYDKERWVLISLLNIQEAETLLLKLNNKSKFEKMLFTAAILTDLLLQRDIKPIIAGRLSVEIYTMSGYTTQDLDFVLNGYEKTSEILAKLGFKKVGKDGFIL